MVSVATRYDPSVLTSSSQAMKSLRKGATSAEAAVLAISILEVGSSSQDATPPVEPHPL